MRRLLVVVLCLVAISACRKKSSPFYVDAEGRYSVIVARAGDDAYDDPEMQVVIDELHKVPQNAIEAADAAKLLAQIDAEKARIAKDKADAAGAKNRATEPVVAVAPFVPSNDPPTAPTAVGSADAGPVAPARPYNRMPLAAFTKYFGPCTEPAAPMTLPGSKAPGTTFQVRADKRCTDALGGGGDLQKLFIFENDVLAGEATKQEIRDVRTADSGVAPPAEELKEIQGTSVMVLPGAPLPPSMGGPPLPDASVGP